GGPPVVAVLLRPAGRRARELGADEPAAGLLQGFQVLPLPGQVPAEEHRLHAPEGGAVVERAVAGVTAAWLQRLRVHREGPGAIGFLPGEDEACGADRGLAVL